MSTQPFIPVGDLHPAIWHEDRAKGIGGSEAAAMFNEGYGCHRQLVMEKRGIQPDYRRTEQQEKTLRRGNKLEDIVAAEFVEATGLKVRRQPSRVSKTHPHARVNMDRQIVAVDGKTLYELTKRADGSSPLEAILANPGPGYLECKTMNSFDFRKVAKEGLTRHNHYILQEQHGLGVTTYKWGVFAILDTTTFELIWFPMLRNEALCGEILTRTEETWELVKDTTKPLPPVLPEGDRRCGNCLWRRKCRGDEYLMKHANADFATDYVDTGDPELIQWAADLNDAEESADQANEIVTNIKALIKARMQELKIAKLRVPEIRRFCITETAGRKGLDGKALEGEINALRKGELPTSLQPDEVTLIAAHPEIPAILLPAIADRIDACKKVGAPSSTFRLYNA